VLGRIHHVAYVVADLDDALGRLERSLGLAPQVRETMADQGVEAVLCGDGEGRVELIRPLDPEGPISRFLDARGEGLHHVAFEVADLEEALAELRGRGVELIDERPRRGLGDHLVAFVHPRSALGVLTELVQADHDPGG
jgi:methylmalonyl-CoA/ethylmalonyl-CoA epimerase